VARCGDCQLALCESCLVTVPSVGEFCWSCASQRGGLRPKRRRRALVAPVAATAPARPPAPAVPVEAARAVLRFEAHCIDREPHSLISGLTERLVRAGVDPEDVVDDDELMGELIELQDRAREAGSGRHRRWSHPR
jgi:hypothetical protein